jgi:DnaJ-class molecular chaperone
LDEISSAAIERAYRELAASFAPDKGKTNDHRSIEELNEARHMLTPQSRET